MARKKKSLWKRFTGRSSRINCFLSYSHRDSRHYAQALSRILADQGVNVFRDQEDLSIGANIADTIREKLQQADFVILIGSPEAFRSEWVLHETKFFLERGSGRTIPIVFEGAQVPDFLRHILWIQEDSTALTKGPSDLEIANLLQAIEHLGNRTSRQSAFVARADKVAAND